MPRPQEEHGEESTFEFEKGDKREVPDFNVFFRYNATYPLYVDCIVK